MAKSTHETKTFEKLQEQVKRFSGRELDSESFHKDGVMACNPFSGETAILSPQEAAVYYLVKNIEMEGFPNGSDVKVFDMMRYWLMAHNSQAYMTLLD